MAGASRRSPRLQRGSAEPGTRTARPPSRFRPRRRSGAGSGNARPCAMGAVSGGRQALRLGGRRGFALRLLGGRPRPVLLLLLRLLALPLTLRLALLLALAAAPARAAARGLLRREGVGPSVCGLLDRPEPLAGRVDQLVGARRVALGRGEQRRPDLARLGE